MGVPYCIGLTLLLSPALDKNTITKVLSRHKSLLSATSVPLFAGPVSALVQCIISFFAASMLSAHVRG